jgi:hypothetical protein
VIVVAVVAVTTHEEVSNLTVAPVMNPVPFTVTEVPPAIGPALKATLVTVGAGWYV